MTTEEEREDGVCKLCGEDLEDCDCDEDDYLDDDDDEGEGYD